MQFSESAVENVSTILPKSEHVSEILDKIPKSDYLESVQKYEKANKVARSHILTHLENSLLDLFITYKSAKAIWEELFQKYGFDDAGKKRYVVSN